MKSSSHKEDSTIFSYPRPLSSIAATVCGLAVFLIMASLLLVSQPIGSAVRGYFYGVDPIGKSNVDYWSNITMPPNFGKTDDIHMIIDGKGSVSESNETDSLKSDSVHTIVDGKGSVSENNETDLSKSDTMHIDGKGSVSENNEIDLSKSDAIDTVTDGKGNVSENNETDLSNVGENQNVVVVQDKSGQDEAKNVSSTSEDSSQRKDEIDSPKSQDISNSTYVTGPDLGVPNLTPTESETKKSSDDTGCELYHGQWIYDSSGPLYTNNTCPVLTQTQNCQGNGRPDKDYENWRWKPSKCELPKFDPKKFLELMRGKTLAFVGDSVARNQMESMLCILWQYEVPKNRGNKKMQRYYFRSTSTMIVRIWSSWLVHQSPEPFENVPPGIAKLHLDKPDEKFFEHIPQFDVIVLSSGHWFAKQSAYILNNEIVGGQLWWPDKSRAMRVNNVDAFGISVETILSSMVSHENYTGLTILRSFSPDHYEGGAWNTGGSCTGKTKPILENVKLVENGFTNIMHRKQVEGFNRAIEKKGNKSKLKLMDITEVFSYRHDGHPGPYRSPDPNKKTKRGPDGRPPPQDCLHWCMPGPVDTWNEFVMEIIRGEFEGSESSNS